MTSRQGRLVSGDGLLTASAEAHLRERQLLQPLFYRTSLAKFSSVITATAKEMLDAWQPSTDIDVAQEMMVLAQRVIIRTVFGKRFQDFDGQLVKAINTRNRYLDHTFFSLIPMAHYIPPWTWWQYRQAMRRIHATIDQCLQVRREGAISDDDLLTMLMRARYKDGTGMTNSQIHNEAMILLITGYESIGDALVWLLYVLSQHPEVERKLAAEVNEVLGGRLPVAGDLHSLTFTSMVLAETLRLYPPSWIMVRMARRQDTLPSGAHITKGAKLYLCQYVMHRHPRYYPDPQRFDPDRFTESARKERPQFAYFPFGGGPRVCIGEHFAKLEATLVLVMAVQRFKFRLVPGQNVVSEPRMTLRPKYGMRLHVESRR